jgi:nitrogen-specific signal transduction histidine kinase
MRFSAMDERGVGGRGGATPLDDLEDTGLGVAHELKNPLSAVKALVQLGLRNPAEHASHERFALLEAEVARIQEILAGFLASARQGGALAAERIRPVPADERLASAR